MEQVHCLCSTEELIHAAFSCFVALKQIRSDKLFLHAVTVSLCDRHEDDFVIVLGHHCVGDEVEFCLDAELHLVPEAADFLEHGRLFPCASDFPVVAVFDESEGIGRNLSVGVIQNDDTGIAYPWLVALQQHGVVRVIVPSDRFQSVGVCRAGFHRSSSFQHWSSLRT